MKLEIFISLQNKESSVCLCSRCRWLISCSPTLFQVFIMSLLSDHYTGPHFHGMWGRKLEVLLTSVVDLSSSRFIPRHGPLPDSPGQRPLRDKTQQTCLPHFHTQPAASFPSLYFLVVSGQRKHRCVPPSLSLRSLNLLTCANASQKSRSKPRPV